MKKKKPALIFEQLEERIFLDANPLLILDPGVDPGGDAGSELVDVPLESAAETAAPEPEKTEATVEEQPEAAPAEPTDQPVDAAVSAGQDSETIIDQAPADEAASEGDSPSEANVPDNQQAESEAQAEDGFAELQSVKQPEEGQEPAETDSTFQVDIASALTAAGDTAEQYDQAGEQEPVGQDSDETVVGGENTDDLSESLLAESIEQDPYGLAGGSGEIIVLEPVDPLINEDFTFTYSFENAIGQTGFGPYVDIYFPTNGIQGDHPNAPLNPDGSPPPPDSDIYDGIRYVKATYAGQELDFVEQRFDATGQIEHPYAKDNTGSPVIVNGQEGDTYVSILLPFGSYTPLQPAADVVVTAHMSNLAEVDQLFDVTTSSGFRFGLDSVNNPQSDPSQPNQGPVTTPYLAELVRFNKSNTASEGETPTGPNYEQSYQIVVDVANEMTVENLVIIDTLPDNIVFIPGSVSGSLVLGSTLVGNELTIELGDVTGVSGPDTTVTFDFYVPDILTLCDPSEQVVNDMRLEADWDPFDDRDPFVQLVIDNEVNEDGTINTGPDDVLEAQPIVIQKVAADENGGNYEPGDIVVYTLDFYVSDYHALGTITIDDLIADGILYFEDAAHQPNFVIQDQFILDQNSGNAYIDDFISGGATSEFNVSFPVAPSDSTGIEILVSDAMTRVAGDLGIIGEDGILEGGYSHPGSAGARAWGTVTYFGRIQENFISPAVPLNQGDSIENSAAISAERHGYNLELSPPPAEWVVDPVSFCTIENGDDTGAAVTLPTGNISKEIYAINGAPVTESPARIKPGDAVTYRLTYDLPISDFQDLVFSDYLPLPIFDADNPGLDPVPPVPPNIWTTDFSLAAIAAAQAGAVPGVGETTFGPDETFFGISSLAPAVSTDGAQNSLIYDWAPYDDPLNRATVVDILFTVEVSTLPFADGLFLTNLVQGVEDGNQSSSRSDDIVQVILDEPELEITKGVIQTDNTKTEVSFTADVGPVDFSAPGSAGFRGVSTITELGLDGTPIDADLLNIDAGDEVSFAITVRNVGHFEAFNIEIDDTLPAGFGYTTIADLNLSVTDGAGAPIDFRDRNGSLITDPAFDFFGQGLEILAPLTGDVDADDQSDNILIITYDLVALTSVQPRQEMINTTDLTNYSSAPGGPNFTPDPQTDPASVTVYAPEAAKEFDFTEIVDGINADNQAVIGEEIHYRALLTLQEGTTNNVRLTDTLDPGLELVSVDSIEILDQSLDPLNPRPAGTVTSSRWGDFSTFGPLTSANGTDISYSFSETGQSQFELNLYDLINSDTDNSLDEIVVVYYTAMAANIGSNTDGTTLANNASLSYDTFTGNESTGDVRAAEVEIIEPLLKVIKTTTVNTTTDSGPPPLLDSQDPMDSVNADSGDLIQYFITIEHDDGVSGLSSAHAYEVEISDDIPTEIIGVTLQSADHSSLGDITSNLALSGNDISGYELTTTTPFELENGDTVTIELRGELRFLLPGGPDIINEARIQWTSLENIVDPAQNRQDHSGFVTTSDIDSERTGDSADPGGAANDYNDWDPTKIILRIPAEKYVVNSEFPGGDADNTDGSTPLPDPVAGDFINSGREAVIGELITYKVEVAIPEAFFFDVTFTDVLDPGLSLVSIDSISLIDEDPVRPPPPLTSYVTIENDQLIGSSYTDDSSQFITYSHAPGNGNSDILTIEFGDVFNLNRNNQYEERIEVVYTVMATNISDNIGAPYGTATSLQNSFTVSVVDPFTGAIFKGTTAQAEPVTVLEPQLEIDKTVAITGPGDAPGDAGDTIEYTITVGHTAASDTSAYDLVLTDAFVAEIINPQIDSAQINGVDVPGFSIIAGQLITPAGLNLELNPAVNEELVLVISGTMADTVRPRDTITNSVEATWTSIPGVRQDISGFADTSDDDSERTGDPGDGGGAANKYLISDDAVTDPVPEPTLAKDLLGTDVNDSANEDDEATIGEQITYQITVSLSEGTTPNAQVLDTLSEGLAYVDNSFAVTLSAGANITSSYGDFGSLPAPALNGQQITFDLGDLTIPGDNTGTLPPVDQGADQLIITYLAVVLDDITINDVVNVGPNSFSNEATFTYAADGSIGPVSAPEVDLVEPVVQIVKTVNSLPDGVALTDADAGDPVTYEITIRHNTTLSGGDAYDVRLQDILPTEIDFGAGAIASVNDNDPLGVGPLTTSDFRINGGVLQFAIGGDLLNDSYTIERDRIITVNLAGALNDAVAAGQEIINMAATDWTGLPEGHPNDGTTAERGDDVDHGLGIYTDEDDALISTAGPDIDKVNDGVVTIGETHTYDIVVTLPEGTTNDLIVYDLLPDGLVVESIVTDLSNLGAAGIDYNFDTPDPVPSQSGNLISLDYGNASIIGDNDPSNDSFTVELTVRVENIGANDDGDQFFNHAYLTYVEPDNDPVRIDDPDDPELLVVEPWISTDKSVVDESGDQTVSRLGEVLTYTVAMVNDGNSTAFEVSLEDVIAPGTGFDPATGLTSIATNAPGAETDPANVTITFDGTTIGFSDESWDLRPGDTLTLRYNLVVLGAYFVPGPHVNTADADWTSLDGDQPEERVYDDGVTGPGSIVDGDQDTDTAEFIVPDGQGEIGDFVWYDANASGTPLPEPEELNLGLRGVQLDISASFNGVQYYSDTFTTDDSGNYLFQGLQGNVEYIVTLDPTTLPDGMVETFARDGVGTNSATHFLTITGGAVDNYLDADFSYTGSGSLGDRVWYDPDGSGLPDVDPSEPGFQNVEVSLFLDLYGDGSFIIDETTTTGVNGIYGFDNLFAATYTVTVDDTTLIAGLTPTDDLDGIGGASDNTAQVALTAAQLVRDDVDFGYNGSGSLGDRVWYDRDGSGLPDSDPAEPGFQNVDVSLFLDLYGDGSFIIDETTTTGVDGIYGFNNLFAATYTVTVDDATLPAGLTPTDDLDGIGGASDHTAQVALTAAQLIRDDADFGYNGIGSLGNRVWYDADSNTIQDPGEPGLENVTVSLFLDLYGDGSFIIDETTTTGVDGIYGFDNLFGAIYTVTVDDTTLPPGYEPTYDLDGIATAHTTQAELAVNLLTREDVDFGYFGMGSIGDRVWYDVNGNGVQDSGEPGLTGITVVMEVDIGSDGTIDFTTSTVTGANGLYLFTDLLEATYTISIDLSTLPGGMNQTYDQDGLTTPHTTELFLSGGDERLDIDFGYVGTGSIGDRVWYDANRNAMQDAGEPGIAGVSVTLTGTFGRSSYTTTASTDANGIYLFTNLPAGTYSITLDPATLPAGLQQTYDPDGLLDNSTTLNLRAGQSNLFQDFGYSPPPEPPEPPQPPIPPIPPQPPEPPVPPEPQVPVPGDPLLAYQFSESAADLMVFPTIEVRENLLPPVPISPIFTGLAEPGTTLALTIYDSEENPVGYQTVIADQSGNWLSNFAGSLLLDTSHQTEIRQTASSMDNSTPGLHNLRIYFNPTMIGLSFSTTRLDAEAIFASTAENVVRSIHQWNNSLLDLDWDQFTGYEFFSPSINPSKHNR